MVKEITSTERVQKKGSSLYILLRKELCEKLNIHENDLIEIKLKKLNEDDKNEKD